MSTDSTDSEQTIGASVCKTIWPYIFGVIQLITHLGAVLQVIFWSIIVLLIVIGAICVTYNVHSITGFLDDFTGLGVGAQISREFDFRLILIVLIILLFACCPLHLSVMLCEGLSKNKVEKIILYIFCGGILLGIRVWAIDSYEYHNFPEDKTVLYCGLYALYLVLLVITCFEIRRTRRAELEQVTITSRFRTFIVTRPTSEDTTYLYGRV